MSKQNKILYLQNSGAVVSPNAERTFHSVRPF